MIQVFYLYDEYQLGWLVRILTLLLKCMFCEVLYPIFA